MSATAHTRAEVTGVDDAAVSHGRSIKSVYVYQAPVRLWHWVNATAITVLAVTGYFIGQPLPSLGGEAINHYLMGYIRFAHFAAGYIFAVGLVGRLYWALVGNHHAREIFWVPVLTKAYWQELLHMGKWYAFLVPAPGRYVGHNPMARLMMFVFIVGLATFMLCTGFALYGEGTMPGSWAHTLFTSWVVPLFGDSLTVHNWHRLGMWATVCFVLVHVYAAIREDIMGRQSIVSTMISGHRTFKD